MNSVNAIAKDLLHIQTLLLIGACIAGMLFHTAKKAMRGELGVASTNPFQAAFWILLASYLFAERPGATGAALVTGVAACLGIVSIGQIETLAPHIIVALGFTTGWAANSGINKGDS